jgi:hypothetical protein
MQAISVWTVRVRLSIKISFFAISHQSFVCGENSFGKENLMIDLKIFPIYFVQIPQKKTF